MNDLVINLHSANITKDDFIELENLLNNLEEMELISISSSNSFNGMEDIIIILSIGGGVAIKQLGVIIVAWINKNKSNKIKYKDIEASGYSSDEIVKIIKELDVE